MDDDGILFELPKAFAHIVEPHESGVEDLKPHIGVVVFNEGELRQVADSRGRLVGKNYDMIGVGPQPEDEVHHLWKAVDFDDARRPTLTNYLARVFMVIDA